MSPRIALLLVNYRNAEDTLECLRSLEETDHRSLSVHLIDNASGDGSAAAIEEYLGKSPLAASVHRLPENLGFAGGMNAGMRRALEEGAEFLVVMNNDVRVSRDFGPELARACLSRPEAVIAGSVRIEKTGKPAWNVGRINPLTLRVEQFLTEYDGRPFDFVSGCLMVIPAGVARRVGLFEERYFMYCEDLDYSLRLRSAGVPLAFFPSIVIWHKVNSTVDKTGFAKDYYFFRNQTYISLRLGGWSQRVLYGLSALAVLAKKVRHPGMFAVFLRAFSDALRNRMGRR